MKNRSDIAVQRFTDGYNCSQAVFFSFSDDVKVEKETALKLACGFGGGMGRNQEVCGAVSGGILTLSAKYGRGEGEDRTAIDETYEKIRELMLRFEKKHGSFICRRLLNDCRLTTEEGQKYFKENDLKNKICIPCVRSVVEIVEELL